MCFLTDVNQLYKTALGMYDLRLTLLVAQQSPKDPKEYLPYLQNLEEIDERRRKFTIDHELGRKQKALGHLYKTQDIEEFARYTESQRLYEAALEICHYDESHFIHILKLLAAHHLSVNSFKEAALGELGLATLYCRR